MVVTIVIIEAADSCWLGGSGDRQTCVHGRCVSVSGTDKRAGSSSRCVCDPGYAGHLCTESKFLFHFPEKWTNELNCIGRFLP